MQQGKTQATKLCMTQMEIELHCYSSKFRQGSPAKPTLQKSEQLAGATGPHRDSRLRLDFFHRRPFYEF